MFRNMTFGRQVRRSLPLWIVVALLASSVLGVSATSADETPNITVILTEFQFNPRTVTLTVGQQVQLNIQNQGKADHSLLSDIPLSQVHYIKADNTPQELSGYEANKILNADAISGHTSMVTLTPAKAGTFSFFSEDEESLGLTGDFVVVAPGATGSAALPAAVPAPAPAPSGTVANDGQSLASQSAATRAMFMAVWGDRAAQEWVTEHNAAMGR